MNLLPVQDMAFRWLLPKIFEKVANLEVCKKNFTIKKSCKILIPIILNLLKAPDED